MFGAVNLITNNDPDKYSNSEYGIRCDSCSLSSLSKFDLGKYVIIFGVDNSSSVYIDSKKKDILVLCKGPTQGLDDTMITAEAEYSINFSRLRRKFCLRKHYNGRNNSLFVNSTKIY